MKYILLLLISLNSLTVHSQSGILAKKKKSSFSPFLFKNIDTISCRGHIETAIYSADEEYFIIGDTICKNAHSNKIFKFYEIFYIDSIYLIEAAIFENSIIDSAISLFKIIAADPSIRIKIAKADYQEILHQKLIAEERIDKENKLAEKKYSDSVFHEYEKALVIARNKNLVLNKWSWNYENEYSRAADIWVKILNPYNKKIKYISFVISAYNDVDDIIREGITGKSEITLKGIGPIDYGATAEYSFDNAFYSQVIGKMKMKQIKIQFFDGSIKLISNPIEISSN